MSDKTTMIEQAKRELHKSNTPLSTSALDKRIDTEHIEQTKEVLRKMIDRGMITITPGWKYKLSFKVRQELQEG